MTRRRSRTVEEGPPRRGVVMVAALALAVVAGSLASTWTCAVIAAKKQTTLASERAQAQLIAESALRRAVARRLADRAYVGETWEIAASELGHTDGAVVEIRVDSDPQERVSEIDVEVAIPGPSRPRSTRTISISVLSE